MKCPRCGSQNIIKVIYETTDIEHKNYDVDDGILGSLFFGLPGALLGFIDTGSTSTTTKKVRYKCNDCKAICVKRKKS